MSKLCDKHYTPMRKIGGGRDFCDICDDEIKDSRIAELEAKLVEIANIAHHGGLTGHDSNDIRRLTLPFWDMAECARLQEQK